jgi:hypothetical protein
MTKVIHKVINSLSTLRGNQFNIELIISSILNCKYILILIINKHSRGTRVFHLWITRLGCSLTLAIRSIPLSRNFQDFNHRCFLDSRPPLTRRPCELVINYITRFLCATASRREGMVYRAREEFYFV